ncbi:trypco2 family protein [Nocardia sp. NPDC057353]|uniref:trypco2 family protein n=1 Tax=Nocardia sp. NPDC057353 TaxID=3346104 RepID=UPI0036312FC8
MEIELADAVEVVRNELYAAVARRGEPDIEFVVGPVELSFELELRRDAKAKLGFKAWVVTGDVEAGAVKTKRHRVAITLTPRVHSGDDVRVGGDHFELGPERSTSPIGR